jgi:hypothetical protein
MGSIVLHQRSRRLGKIGLLYRSVENHLVDQHRFHREALYLHVDSETVLEAI